MKKVTILVFLFISYVGFSQATSFEAVEGFALGPINLQNGWTVYTDIPNGPQISNMDATDGSLSLQIIYDSSTSGGTLNGAFSPVFTGSGSGNFTVDINAGATGLSSVFVATIKESTGAYTSLVHFNFDDKIRVLDDSPSGPIYVDTGASVPRSGWFELKIENKSSENEILYYIDNNPIYSGSYFMGDRVDRFVLFTDNFGSDAFFDNPNFVEETLSVTQNNISKDISIFPSPTKKDLNLNFLKNLGESKIEVYSVNGLKIFESKLIGNGLKTIPVEKLTSGLYFIKIISESIRTTKKFVKS